MRQQPEQEQARVEELARGPHHLETFNDIYCGISGDRVEEEDTHFWHSNELGCAEAMGIFQETLSMAKAKRRGFRVTGVGFEMSSDGDDAAGSYQPQRTGMARRW